MKYVKTHSDIGISTLPIILEARIPSNASGYVEYHPAGGKFSSPGPGYPNLVVDPRGKAGVYWPASSAHTTVTPNTDISTAFGGTVCNREDLISRGCSTGVLMENDGTADSVSTITTTVVASKKYAISIFVAPSSLSGDVTVTAELAARSVTLGTISAGMYTPVIRRFEGVFDTSASETTVYFKFTFAGGALSSSIFVTGAQIEGGGTLRGWPTPFFCGATHECSWTSFVDASTSSRQLSVTEFSPTALNLNASEGTIVAWVKPNGVEADLTTCTWLTASRNPSLTALMLYKTNAGAGPVRFAYNNGTNCTIDAPAIGWTRWGEIFIVARYKASTTLDLCVNGQHATQVVNTQSAPTPNLVYIPNGTLNHVSYLGPIMFINGYKSTDWVNAISADAANINKGSSSFLRYLNSGDTYIPFRTNSNAYVAKSGGAYPFDYRGLIAFDGGSNTSGQKCSSPSMSYGKQSLKYLYPSFTYMNTGYSGRDISEMNTDAITGLDPYIVAGKKNILVMHTTGVDTGDLYFGGGMSFSEIATEVHSRMSTYVTNRKAAGWEVYLITQFPVVNQDIQDINILYNDLLRGDFAGGDGLIDFTADTYIGVHNSCYAYPEYWADVAHVNDAGADILGRYIGEYLNENGLV